MNRLSQLLTTLLLGDRSSAQEAVQTLSKGSSWDAAIELSNLWRVIPQFRGRIHELEVTLPMDVVTKLQEASVIGTAQSLAALRLCADTICALESAGIDSLAFKGTGLIGNLYASSSERMVTDVDILIDDSDVKRAVETIAGSSSSFNINELLAYVQFLAKQSYHRLDNDFVEVPSKDGIKIDLQWRFGAKPPPAMEAERILERAERVKVFGVSIKVACPCDAIAIGAHHAMGNNFTPATTVKDLCDARRWWNVQGTRWKVEETVNHSHDCRLNVPLMAMWGLLTQFDPDSPAIFGLNEFHTFVTTEEIRDSVRLQKSLNIQSEGTPLNADLLRILIDPMWLTRYIANKVRNTTNGSTDLRSHGETSMPPMSKRATTLLREISRLNLGRLESYAAIKRSENTYSNHQPYPLPVAQIASESDPIYG